MKPHLLEIGRRNQKRASLAEGIMDYEEAMYKTSVRFPRVARRRGPAQITAKKRSWRHTWTRGALPSTFQRQVREKADYENFRTIAHLPNPVDYWDFEASEYSDFGELPQPDFIGSGAFPVSGYGKETLFDEPNPLGPPPPEGWKYFYIDPTTIRMMPTQEQLEAATPVVSGKRGHSLHVRTAMERSYAHLAKKAMSGRPSREIGLTKSPGVGGMGYRKQRLLKMPSTYQAAIPRKAGVVLL